MNQNWKSLALVGIVSSVVTIGGLKLIGSIGGKDVIMNEVGNTPSLLNRFTSDPSGAPVAAPGDFTYAAEVSTPAVVHIKATSSRQQQRQIDIFDLFGEGMGGGRRGGSQKQESSGSGVIISTDGYIVTNNHVVEGAEQLEVVMSDKRTFKAKVIGTDPSTDIAVIQIPTKGLPALTFGNSDAIRVGEWVVAVGNPFNLESTVTAGIVSAKGRGLPIISEKMQQEGTQGGDTPIESFIQTDAVVNPGNSGGALVNARGELIGINTAIASPTGSFAGYAFAVPASLVKKVSADIIKFGGVQRGYIGITPEELDSKKVDEYDLKVSKGIYIKGFGESSAAKDAGIKIGDVITKVDGQAVESAPEFRELVGRKRPGETVALSVNRDGQSKEINVILRNRDGGKDIIKNDDSAMAMQSLGADFGELTDRDKQKLARVNISGGVKVNAVQSGKLARVGVEEGFVITKIDEKPIKSVKELKAALADKQGQRVQVEGLYLEYPADVYSFGFNL